MRHKLLPILGILFLGLATPGLARAQQGQEVSTKALQNLEETLQNPAQRAILINQIKALIALRTQASTAAPTPQAPGDELVALLSQQATRIGAAIAALANLAPLAGFSAWNRRVLADPQTRQLWLHAAGLAVGILAFALLLGYGAARALRPALRRLHNAAQSVFWRRGLAALTAILLGWLPPLMLYIAGTTALAVTESAIAMPPTTRALVLAVLNACALSRAIGATAEALLLPGENGVRFLKLPEETADYWLVWVSRLARLVVYGWFLLLFALQAGLQGTVYATLLKLLGLALTGLVIMLILQNRAAVAGLIRGRGQTGAAGLRAHLGNIWHIIAILYLLGVYGVWAMAVPGGFTFLLSASLATVTTLAVARGLDLAGTNLANRFLTIRPELEQRLPGLQKRVNLYAPALISTGRGFIYLIATILVLQSWGLTVLSGLESPAGQRFIGGIITIGLSLGGAILLWEGICFMASLYLSRPGADGTPLEHTARARTLLPLFRKSLAILLGIVVVLVALGTMGLNIGPLLAGAGIAGIAIGFGAQSLVKDVITGIFVLMQDAVSVGDVVTVAGKTGGVEQISIRSIRLRDFSGIVYVIPFSEVTTVENLTKDFAYAVFNIGVAYREDVDQVTEIFRQLGADMQADETYGPRILAPIEIVGLDQFADSAVVIKGRIMTRPQEQWGVLREFHRRVKRRFDELGIELPFPHQTIYFGADKEGKAPPAHLLMERPTSGT